MPPLQGPLHERRVVARVAYASGQDETDDLQPQGARSWAHDEPRKTQMRIVSIEGRPGADFSISSLAASAALEAAAALACRNAAPQPPAAGALTGSVLATSGGPDAAGAPSAAPGASDAGAVCGGRCSAELPPVIASGADVPGGCALTACEGRSPAPAKDRRDTH